MKETDGEDNGDEEERLSFLIVRRASCVVRGWWGRAGWRKVKGWVDQNWSDADGFWTHSQVLFAKATVGVTAQE